VIVKVEEKEKFFNGC